MNRILLESVASKVKLELIVVRQPWARCLSDLKAGLVDGVYPLSFNAARDKDFAYPKRNGRPNEAQRLMIDSYSLYRRKGDQNVQWDGVTLKVADQHAVGVQRGYSIGEYIKGMGVKTDDGAYPISANLQKLIYQRVAAVALRTGAGDLEVASQLALSRGVEKLSPPLLSKPYFLVFSKKILQERQDLALTMWQLVETERESAMYRSIEDNFR